MKRPCRFKTNLGLTHEINSLMIQQKFGFQIYLDILIQIKKFKTFVLPLIEKALLTVSI